MIKHGKVAKNLRNTASSEDDSKWLKDLRFNLKGEQKNLIRAYLTFCNNITSVHDKVKQIQRQTMNHYCDNFCLILLLEYYPQLS